MSTRLGKLNKAVGDRLKLVIHKSLLSNKAFAESIGITPQFLSNIIVGKKSLPPERADQISKQHNVDKEWLLSGIGEFSLDDHPLLKESGLDSRLIHEIIEKSRYWFSDENADQPKFKNLSPADKQEILIVLKILFVLRIILNENDQFDTFLHESVQNINLSMPFEEQFASRSVDFSEFYDSLTGNEKDFLNTTLRQIARTLSHSRLGYRS